MGFVIVVGPVDNVDIPVETLHLVIIQDSMPDIGPDTV